MNSPDYSLINKEVAEMKKSVLLLLMIMFLSMSSLCKDITIKIEKLGKECQAGKYKACSKLIIIATTHEDEKIRDAALEQLGEMRISNSSDQVLLAKIAGNDKNKFVRATAAKKLLDQNLLLQIIKKDTERWVREAAVEALTDETILIEVAWMESDCYTSAKAVEKITNQKVLAEIAKEAKDWVVRQRAVELIQDEKILEEIARTDKSEYVRLPTVLNPKLTNKIILDEISNCDSDGEVRQAAALKSLVAQDELKKLCDIQSDNRKEAVQKLNHQAALAIIANNDPSRDVQDAALERLTDQGILTELAKKGFESRIRGLAIRKLKDEALLIEIAKIDKDSWIRSCAISSLNNEAVLGQIVRTDKENFYYAIKRLCELKAGKMLEGLLNESRLSESIRIESVKSLIDINYSKKEFITESLIKIILNTLKKRNIILYKELMGVIRKFDKNAALEVKKRAPKITVNGRLVEYKYKTPLSNVSVFLGEKTGDYNCTLHSDLVAYTDNNGVFVFDRVPLGCYTIVYSEKLKDIPFIFKVIDQKAFNTSIKSGTFSNGRLDEGYIVLFSSDLNVSLKFQVLHGELLEFIPEKNDLKLEFEVH